MAIWNANVPYEDTTGYIDESYFDSEIGYLSCYAIRNPYQHKDKWMVDSGCTNHISPFPEDFISWENNTRKCKTASGNIMPIFGPGTVIIRHHNGECHKTLVLTGVYYTPHVSHHLLSIMALTKQGFMCMIRDKTQIWNRSGNLVIMAEQLIPSETLHWFLSTAMTPDSKAASIQLNQDYVLWHYHMGHCSHNALRHAPDHVSGIPKLEIPPKPWPCQECLLGKAHERPFPPSDSRGDLPLGLVHTDLCEFPSAHGRRRLGWWPFWTTFQAMVLSYALTGSRMLTSHSQIGLPGLRSPVGTNCWNSVWTVGGNIWVLLYRTSFPKTVSNIKK